MIDFEPSEEQRLVRESVADFAKSTLAPRVREVERTRQVPEEVRKLAHEMGLGLVTVPERAGGQGLGMMTAVLLEEELGAADAAAAFGLAGPGAFGTAVAELGAPEQVEASLAGFADEDGYARFGAVAWSERAPCKARAGFSTVATAVEMGDPQRVPKPPPVEMGDPQRVPKPPPVEMGDPQRVPQTPPVGGGYKLTGEKAFVVNAHLADRFVVFAQVDAGASEGWGGIGAFVVRRDNPGLTVGARHDTLGLDAADFGEISLKDAFVEASARLLGDAGDGGFTRATLRFFAKRALVVAARAVGLARFAFDLAREHCANRTAFGKPIGHFQAVAFNLSDRHMDVESARWLVWKAAAAWEQAEATDPKPPTGAQERALHATAQAAAFALEAAMRTADDCVSLHGGSGFIRDLVAEKLMRDGKQLALCCPTAEQLDQLASALDLGAPLDPALVLPTPDAQAIFT